ALELVNSLENVVRIERYAARHHARHEKRRVEVQCMTRRSLRLGVAFGDAQRESVRSERNRGQRIELGRAPQLRNRFVDAAVQQQQLAEPLMSSCIIRVEGEGALIVSLGFAPAPSQGEQI